MQRSGLILAGVSLAIAFFLTIALAASAARTKGDIYNTRYCEVLELKGLPPTGQVTVWNTIGFSHCPAAQWNALDPAAIAAANGDTAVVLNGPRYWLMDEASGRTGSTKVFGGLRFRQVATIPIRTNEELAQTPYSEHTIVRRNTWTWNKGRTIYELHAPGGVTYVMQAYSQIKDQNETLADLPGLGARLQLPAGWTYSTRKLRKDLVLAARGTATVVQDELLNTYQREP